MPPVRDADGWIAAHPQASARENAFQMGDLFRIVARRQRLIRNVALATIAAALIAVLVMPTQWTTTASVMLDQRKNTIADQSAVLSALPTDAASLQNQLQILTSRDLAGRVIDRLGLMGDPEFAGKGGGFIASLLGTPSGVGASRDEVIDRFLKRLSVDSLGLSTTITIAFTANDPGKAARIANAVAEAYIADQVSTKRQITGATTQWLTDRINRLARQVEAAESETQRYRAENNLNDSADGSPLSDQQLTAINAQIVTARTDLAQKEAVYERVKQLAASGNAADVSQVVSSPLIVQLRTQQADLVRQESELTTRYGAKHPKLIAVQKQRQDLDAKIATEVDRIAGSIASDLSVARAQVASLEASLRGAEKHAGVQNMARVKLKALQANATSTRTMYEAFVGRLRETQDAIQTTDTRIISRAPVPETPSAPKRTIIVAASVPAGLLLGIILALIAERFAWGAAAERAERIEKFEEPEPAMPAVAIAAAAPRPEEFSVFQPDPFRGAPVVGDLPNAVPLRAASYVFDWPNAAYTHAVGRLLERVRGVPGAKVVALASAQPGEGATTIAVSLARMAALKGLRVIVVDADFAAPAAASLFGAAAAPAGIAQVLTGASPLSRAVQRDARSSAMLLAPSAPVADAGVLAGSQAFADLFTHLRQAADLVIVDCPPVLGGSAFRLVARHCDTTLLVVRDGPQRPAIGHAVNALASMGAPRVGIVIAH